jgi:hypothetical protein
LGFPFNVRKAFMCNGGLWIAALFLAFYVVACGGGHAPITPPPPAGNFSDASLLGQYAFAMSGVDGASGAYVARVGSFTADGSGQITGGLEDVLNLGNAVPASQISLTNGTYRILPNGKGSITLNASGGGTLQLSVALKSNAEGFLVQVDGAAATSGSLSLQTSADFAAGFLNGKYVFDCSGRSFAGATPSAISLIGQFAMDGNGNVTSGVMDINDGAFAPTGATPVVPATYQLDSNGNGTNFGRGTITLNGRTYAFYIVDNTRIRMLEEDAQGGSQGDAVLQQTGAIATQNSTFQGSFVFLSKGFLTTGNFGPLGRAGRFTADGSGAISKITFDQNIDGKNAHVSQTSSVSSATYAIDTNNAGSGRGTFTFHSSSVGTLTFVFYLSAPGKAVIQDVSTTSGGDGLLLAQAAGPFTTSTLAGNFILNWTGVQLVSPSAFQEDFIGQAAQNSAASSNFSGVVDYVELGLNSVNNGVTLGTGVSGTLTITADGTQNNTYKIAIGSSSPFTVNFLAYFADNQTVLMLCSDSTRTTGGIAVQQTQ